MKSKLSIMKNVESSRAGLRPNDLGPAGRDVAHNIERLREAQHLTQKELAARMTELGRPVTMQIVSKIEQGERRVDADDLTTAAVALGVNVNALLLPPDTDDNDKPEMSPEVGQRAAVEGADPKPTNLTLNTPTRRSPEGVLSAVVAVDSEKDSRFRGRADQEFLARYRQHVALRHGRLEPPDFDRRRRVPISDIYVEQAIVAPEVGEAGLVRSAIGLREFDDRIARTVLLGDPGGGKTTACTVLMHRHAEDQDRSVPFLVTVRDFASTGAPERSVIAFIERELEILYQCPAPVGLVEKLLRDGQALVVFDGLDELLEPSLRAEMASVIELFCMDFPASSVLVTSRLVGYSEAQLDPAQFTVYRLAGFAQEQAAEYIRKWFALAEYNTAAEAEQQARTLLAESSTASDLRTNPLMLALLCILYRGEGSLPRDRAGIYERCAELLFRRWDERRRIRAAPSIGHLTEPVTRHVAWWMFTRDPVHSSATERELVAEVAGFLAGRGYEHESDAAQAAVEFVQFARGRMWVLSDVGTTPDGERLYAFTHRTFLEYFTASHLAVTSDTPEQLAAEIVPFVRRREWEEVAELAVHIKDRMSDRGADRTFSAMLSEALSSLEYSRILRFWLRFAIFTFISPAMARALTHRVFDYVNEVPAQADGAEMLASLLFDKSAIHEVIASELTDRIDSLYGSDSEAEQLAGAKMVRTICQVQHAQHGALAQASGGRAQARISGRPGVNQSLIAILSGAPPTTSLRRLLSSHPFLARR